MQFNYNDKERVPLEGYRAADIQERPLDLAPAAVQIEPVEPVVTDQPTARQYLGFTATMTLAMGESIAVTEAVKHDNAATGAIAALGAVAFTYAFARTFREVYGPIFTHGRKH